MTESPPLRVAIVGSGPAGMYAAGHLLENPAGTLVNGRLEKLVDRPVEVDVLDRLPTPWGLIRGGVAPDHPDKKRMALLYDAIAHRPGFRFIGNIAVGEHVQPAELARWYDAVIYAVGAEDERRLGIPGEDLPGCSSARQFVGWYNGHPDFSGLDFKLDTQRAVIIGNGNVAMDVARILLSPVDALKQTDIAAHALDALAASKLEEVVILGRRSANHAAFNYPELAELGDLPDVAIYVVNDWRDDNSPATGHESRLKLEALSRLCRHRKSGSRRIVFCFNSVPTGLTGTGRVEQVEVASRPDADSQPANRTIETGLVLGAIGYRGRALAGLPFDGAQGVIPSQASRVLNGAEPVPGAYVTGWIRRGPRGIIGSNKKCARDCVAAVMEDARADGLPRADTLRAAEVLAMLAGRNETIVSYSGWQAIDRLERQKGRETARSRVKITTMDKLLSAAG